MYARWGHVFTTPNPGQRWTALIEMLGAACIVGILALAWRHRSEISPVMVAYVAVSLALILGYSTVGTRPRMVLDVVPLFVWAACWLRRRARRVIIFGMAPLLFGTTYLFIWRVVP